MSISKPPNKQSTRESFQLINDYWVKKLDGIKELQLLKDPSRSLAKTEEKNYLTISLDRILLNEIGASFQDQPPSQSLILFAALKVLLYRYCGQNDFCIGKTIEKSDDENLTSKNNNFFHLQTLPIRSEIDGSMHFDIFLKKINRDLDEAIKNQITINQLSSFLDLKNEKDLNLLFPVIFDYQKKSANNVQYLSSRLNLGHFNSTLLFGFLENGDKIEGNITFDTNFYRYETIQRMASHFLTLLQSIHSDPSLNLGLLNIIPKEEETLLLETFNNTESPLPYGKTVLDLFEQQVVNNPNALAVEFEGENLSYQQLDVQSNQLAHFLIKNGIKPESLVPICMDRSLEMIIGILGILKAGGAYVPIDHTYPNERIEFILSDTNASFILTTFDLKERLQKMGEVICLDEKWPEIEKIHKELLQLEISQNQLAYVIYTSGSTGKPKGVMIEHKSLLAFLLARISYYHNTSSGILIPSFSFDASIPIIFGSLTTGGKLILCKSDMIKNPTIIKDKLDDSETILCVPSYYRFLLEEGLLTESRMSKVILGGERLDESLVKLHFEKSGGTSLYNEYGPTECTVWASVAKIQTPNEKITIGKPIDFSKIYILNKDNQLNPVNITGELCIAGETVGRGYLNLPELTAEKFVKNPFSTSKDAKMYRTGDLARWLPDGNIEYLGRIDDQVKIRGYRIELGEIESTINSLVGVKESAVILREDLPGQKQLVGYVVCQEPLQTINRENRVFQIKERLHEILPNYMVPSNIVLLDHLPLSANNKIDKKNLPKPLENTSKKKEPTTDLEKTISKIWCSALKKETIDNEADFFEMGGHSLLAVKVMAALEKEIGSKLAINQIFKHPNILELAKAIENTNQNQTGWNSLVPIKPTGNKPPLYIVHGVGSTVSIYYSLAKYIEDDQPIYGFQPKGLDGIETPNKSLEEMASYYISLIIDQNPHGPYNISGYSFGGYVAYEMAKQLYSMGKNVNNLILFDTPVFKKREELSLFEKIKLKSKIITNNVNFMLNEPNGYFEKKTRSFKRKRDKILVKMKLKPDPKFLEDSKSVLNRVAINNAEILMKYLFSPYQGHMHLFRVKTRSFYVEEPKYYGWNPLVEKVNVVHVSGHHDNIFHKPEILKEMAEKIQKVLDEKSGS